MHEDNNSNSIGDAKDVAVRLYLHDSLSMEEIGKHLGVSYSTVRR